MKHETCKNMQLNKVASIAEFDAFYQKRFELENHALPPSHSQRRKTLDKIIGKVILRRIQYL